MKIENILKYQNIAILGFGKEGRATLLFLEKNGIKNITILDKSEIPDEYSEKYICISGAIYLQDLESFDLIIKSVGISPYENREIQSYSKKIITATEIFFSNHSGKVIGITGTKGKSTTSSLCAHVLKSLGYKVALLGNIGNPALEIGETSYDYIVYELSSYMLENFQPKLEIGVLINIFVDHLDWYNSEFEFYKDAKLNVLKNAKYKIINHELASQYEELIGDNYLHYNERHKDINFEKGNYYLGNDPIFTHEGIHLEGEHNMENITCVLSILRTLKIDIHDIKKILTNFCALPHRLQDIGTFHGIRFINDSISTTPESTIEAIKTYGKNTETIFLGGSDRGYNFENLILYIKKYNIKNIVLFPNSGGKIKKLLDSSYTILETNSMQDAVDFAYKTNTKGSICLLSTASPSYSLWKNFEEQGKEFKKFVSQY